MGRTVEVAGRNPTREIIEKEHYEGKDRDRGDAYRVCANEKETDRRKGRISSVRSHRRNTVCDNRVVK